MKTLEALICGLAFTLPAMLVISSGQPDGTEKSDKEAKAVKESGDVGSETSTARGPQEEITNSVGMKMRLIPAGSFMMGAVPGDSEADDDEKPRHSVEISKAFYIGVYEVTQAEWEAVMGTTQRDLAGRFDLHGEGPRYPVYYVSWNETQEFCRKLSEKEGVTYRLPTEAEWEYAARGGVEGKIYVWGDEKMPLVNGVKHANVADESVKGSKVYEALETDYDKYGYFAGYNDGYAETSPVGSYTPNGFGLYDMAGNVWEWCADWYDEEYYAVSPADNPAGPSSGVVRVLRGGGWVSLAGGVRSSFRLGDAPVYGSGDYGFRVVRDVE